MYTCIDTYIHTYMHRYIHTYVHTYRHTYIHIFIHTFIHTYRHTHTQVHSHKPTFATAYKLHLTFSLLSIVCPTQSNSQSNPHHLASATLKGIDLKSQNNASILTVKDKMIEKSTETAWKLIRASTDRPVRVSLS